MDRLANVLPGEVLLKEFMEPSGISVDRLAAYSGIGKERLQKVISGTEEIDNEVARGLSVAFGTSYNFWLVLQKVYDDEEEKDD